MLSQCKRRAEIFLPAGERLFLYTTQGDAFDNVIGKKQINDDNRQNGNGNHHVDLAGIKVHVIGATERCNHDWQRLLLFGGNDQRRDEVIVPGTDKSEDCLHSKCRLHDRQDDPIEGGKLVGTVNPSSLNQGHGQRGLHIAEHKVEYGRRCDGRNDQRQQRIIHTHIGNQPEETHGSHLGRHHQDHHNEGESCLFQPEGVSKNSVSSQCGEVSYQSRTGGGNKQTVQDALNEKIPNAKKTAKSSDFYVINTTSKPSILVECGFLSNPEEERLLVSEEYQEDFCYVLFYGILSYFSVNNL